MKIAAIILGSLLVLCVIFLIQQTNSLKLARYTWESPRVPRGFDGYRIALLSDLHNKRFGKNQARLARVVKAFQPDMIALIGDFADLRTKNLDSVAEFLEGVKDLAPIYYADGNHDLTSPFYGELHALLAAHGVTVLAGDYLTLTRGGDGMALAGFPCWNAGDITRPADIALYHDPALFPSFAAHGYGLVLSGHNHGGQIALPGGRAVFAPAGGFFPEYNGGVYREGGSVMVLSRGLGTTYIPVRAFARPEVVGIVLKAAE